MITDSLLSESEASTMTNRKLSPDYRLQGYSTEDLVNEWEIKATGICHGRKLLGRKLKPGPLLNALVLWYMALDRAEQNGIATQAVAMLEAHLNEPGHAGPQPETPHIPVVNSAPKRKKGR